MKGKVLKRRIDHDIESNKGEEASGANFEKERSQQRGIIRIAPRGVRAGKTLSREELSTEGDKFPARKNHRKLDENAFFQKVPIARGASERKCGGLGKRRE